LKNQILLRWEDHATGEAGDSYHFLSNHRTVSAGSIPFIHHFGRIRKRTSLEEISAMKTTSIDTLWQKALAQMTPQRWKQLYTERGYSEELCRWLENIV
jgi:hypothetical protein